MKKTKIKIAFVKFGGLAAGGTEKYLQTLACNLPKDRFEIDYYYTDGVPLIGNNWKHPDTDSERKKYMCDHNINLIHVDCRARYDVDGAPYPWMDHDFFKLFDAEKYDIVQTGRGGYKEYPFCEMSDSYFVDSIHSCGDQGVEKRDNILKTVLISDIQKQQWIKNGGDPDKVEVIPTLVEFPPKERSTLREELDIPQDAFVFGMHQRNCENIFSHIPLTAYSMIEGEKNYYVLLGGAEKYRAQAQQLGLTNIKFLDFISDVGKINNFVSGIDAFAHGRYDGEVCSAAIIEALRHGKPIITHPGINMGHLEQVEDCGIMAHGLNQYVSGMLLYQSDSETYKTISKNCINKFENKYSLKANIDKYIKIYEEVHEFLGENH